MPDFAPHAFDYAAARQQLGEFGDLLRSAAEFSEGNDLLPFFRARRQLVALFGLYNASQSRYDRVAQEYPLFGAYACDFAVGDSAAKAYTFVELEDARPDSVFVTKPGRLSPVWARRFEQGYSQLIDWFCKLSALTDTPDMEATLGKRSISYAGVLVIGRDHFLSPAMRLRLEWRREHIVVGSKKIVCLTYDQLFTEFSDRLDLFASAAKVGG